MRPISSNLTAFKNSDDVVSKQTHGAHDKGLKSTRPSSHNLLHSLSKEQLHPELAAKIVKEYIIPVMQKSHRNHEVSGQTTVMGDLIWLS
jgi:hypothetical protein